MKMRCRFCGETFVPEPEDVAMYEEGWIDHLPNICYDCVDIQNQQPDYDEYSDADPGL